MFKIIKKIAWEKLQQDFSDAQKKIKQYQEELAEAKVVLDIRVKAKTRQLKEEAQIFEDKFEHRAKQLKEKIVEFESFQKLMVDRELKMVELKSQLEEAQNKIVQLKQKDSFSKESKKPKAKKRL